MEMQSHTEVVHAPIRVCFDTIVDFARYPDWFSGITAAHVEQADPDAGLWTVRYELNMVIKTISYTLSYQSQRPTELHWHLARGDVKDVKGNYLFTRLEDDLTEAECTQAIDIGFWIPGPIKRGFEKSALGDSVREFKKAAEQRVG
jgi:ribosome-associated toxin RatA of RatAB toxin-antitoxin module